MNTNLNHLVARAVAGDKQALEHVVEHIKDFVYNLSLKMLLFPEDAKDASQEILIRVVTRLSTFQGASKFETWVYRIATNYLITEKSKKKAGFHALSFEDYAVLIDTGQSDTVSHAKNQGELLLLEEEVKVSCTHGLLFCLGPMARLIYILGEILDFNSMEGAEILEISPENFRKQLSRSRQKIRGFLEAKCGLVNAKNPCRCKRKIDFLIDKNTIDPQDLQFAHHTQRSIDMIDKINSLDRAVSVFQSVPVVQAPAQLLEEVRKTINSIAI